MIHVERFVWARENGRRDSAAWIALKCDGCGALGPKRPCSGLVESEWDAAAARAAFPSGWTEKIRNRSHLVALCPKCAGTPLPAGRLSLRL